MIDDERNIPVCITFESAPMQMVTRVIKRCFVYPNDINTNNYDYEYLTKVHVVIIKAVTICQILKHIQYLGPHAHSSREL